MLLLIKCEFFVLIQKKEAALNPHAQHLSRNKITRFPVVFDKTADANSTKGNAMNIRAIKIIPA